jgi:hypothetical protein
MALEDPDRILALLRDPNVDSQQVAAETGFPREEAARAARLLVTLPKARGEEIVSLPLPLASALLRAALAAGRADLLAEVAAAAGDRAVAKEAKRGLHVLKARGVAVPEPARPAPPPPPAVVEELFPCYASSIDGQGERAVWLARNVPGRGIEVGQAVISDETGLVELQVGLLGRKEYRNFGRDIGTRGQAMGVAEVPPALARALVLEARRRNDESGRPVPDGADAWVARLGPAALLEDPAATFASLSPEEERAALDASEALHELPMLKSWLADEPVLRALAAKLDEIAASTVLVDERQREEAREAALSDALEGWLDALRRDRIRRRLLAVAVHLRGMGQEAHARAAAAASRALAGGTAARDVPVVRRMVERAFPRR